LVIASVISEASFIFQAEASSSIPVGSVPNNILHIPNHAPTSFSTQTGGHNERTVWKVNLAYGKPLNCI